MAGCTTMMGTNGPVEQSLTQGQIARICHIWPYVTWADADTDQTIMDAKINNARHDGFCESVLPPPKAAKK
jgi:hypothetical protein